MTGIVKPPVVLFYVQHLLGIGHVFRATRVARALARLGCEAHLVWGGTATADPDLSDLKVKYLTAVRSDSASFSNLVHENGQPFTVQDQEARRADLLEYYDMVQPDILITEAFPFGRRQMHFELIPLLEAAERNPAPPMIVASIRDIMQEGRREKRVQESLDAIHKWYNLVLVHGDPSLIRIEETLQGASKIENNIRYTGLVSSELQVAGNGTNLEYNVLVSSGGGAVGLPLMQSALQAMKLSAKYPDNWCLTVGTEMPETDYQALQRDCPHGMKIVRFLPDLVNAIGSSKVSVSLAGYNTVADVLKTDTACVLVPFAGEGETEQLRRAELLAKKGIVSIVLPDQLSPKNLAKAIDTAEQQNFRESEYNLDGANNSARILLEEYSQRKNAT